LVVVVVVRGMLLRSPKQMYEVGPGLTPRRLSEGRPSDQREPVRSSLLRSAALAPRGPIESKVTYKAGRAFTASRLQGIKTCVIDVEELETRSPYDFEEAAALEVIKSKKRRQEGTSSVVALKGANNKDQLLAVLTVPPSARRGRRIKRP
jgi:hypothetical protein